jgi:FkbM family methyltransferase
MINKIFAGLKNPKKVWRYFIFILYYIFRKKRGALFIIGLESGGVFRWMYRGYEKCYCFEANPERFKKLQKKYSKYEHINLFNVAIAQYDGEITFNISSNNNGASSSIGSFKKEWQQQYQKQKIEMVKSITVPCLNLYNFCIKNNIGFIDDYVSDIQGMDLEVLKTMKPMIDNNMIDTISCEVTKNDRQNIYYDLPDNSENGFASLLSDNYDLIAKGWGILKNNKIDKIPDDVWEMDCRWRVKNKN